MIETNFNRNIRLSVPELTREALDRYQIHGTDPGAFLRACLENDFLGACSRADSINAIHLVEIANFMNWELPFDAYGSAAKVDAWMEKFRKDRHAD